MKTADGKDIEIGYGKKYFVVERCGGYDGEPESVTKRQYSFDSFRMGVGRQMAVFGGQFFYGDKIFESENEANKEYNKHVLEIRENIKGEIEYLQSVLDEPPVLLPIKEE